MMAPNGSMSLNPTLRKAISDDSAFAYEVKKAAFRSYTEQVWGWDEAEQQKLHQQRFGTQDFRVISVDARDVGVIAMAVGPDCLALNQLFLLPEHQGKGIGRMCVRIILEEAGRLGLPVRLRALKINKRAQAFFEGLGFVPYGETATHILMEGPGGGEEPKPRSLPAHPTAS
ncbi:MAG: GNAT family N-acetyltransferase [Phycisphaeraceae bacterium]|nr:GNAT family N-acetyltransferase [Phycisphaeraceae bacterium]